MCINTGEGVFGMSISTFVKNKNNRGKVFALLAGGIVLGLGATATLAVWTDNEWVFGGVDSTNNGIVTSAFDIEQNRTLSAATGWDEHDLEANAANISFTGPALALTPGDEVYTHVSIRTTVTNPASVGGTLLLQPAHTALAPHPASSTTLWNALRVRAVVTTGTTMTCSLANFTVGATYVLGGPSTFALMGDVPTASQTLLATGGNQQNYCFEITLPDGSPSTLQGLGVTPVWEFRAESN